MRYLTSFPTAIFTVLLVFCVAWWVISLLFSAAEFDSDTGDGDGDGIGDQIGRVLGSGPVPIPLAVTILAFSMWASSLILQAIVADDDSPRLGIGIALLVIAVAIAVGLVAVRQASKPLRHLFHTEAAPSRRDAIGSICKVRTVVAADGGQAEIVNGGLRGSLISVRAVSGGPFRRGDHALIIDYDDATNRYLIAEIDEEFVPGS